MMKLKVYILLCFILVCALFSLSAWFFSQEGFDKISPIQDEDRSKYILHREELIPRENIASFIVDSDRIYIYYDKVALINVYTTDGSFEYGIQISTIPNGRGDIAVKDGNMYVESRQPIIFVFQGDQMIESIEPSRSKERYLEVRELISKEKNTADVCNFRLTASGSSIIRMDTQETVIRFPQQSNVAKTLLIFGLLTLFLSLYGFERLFLK